MDALKVVPVNTEQVIFAIRPGESKFSVRLYLEASGLSNKLKLGIRIGKKRFYSSFELSINEWTDIVVTRLENTLILYVDHEKDPETFLITPERENAPALDEAVYLGGLAVRSEYSSHSPLIGYLGSVAVFDKVLEQKDVDDFHENDPFIFEDNLVALYSFDFGAALELVSGSKIDIPQDNGALVFVSEAGITEEKYQYRINKELPAYRDCWIWGKAFNVLVAISEYYRITFGLDSDNDAIIDLSFYFAQELTGDPSLSGFIDKGLAPRTMRKEDVLNVIQVMNSSKNIKFLIAAQFDSIFHEKKRETVSPFIPFVPITNFIAENERNTSNISILEKEYSIPYVERSIFDFLKREIRDGRNNNKVFYACEIRRITPDGSYIEVSGINSKQFSKGQFSFDIWFYSDEDDVSCEILSFEKKSDEDAYGWRFSVGVDEKGHVYCVNGGEEFSIFTEEKPYEIGSNQWNNLFLIYDGTVMSFYLGGELIGNIDVGSDLSPHGPCFIAKGLDGFIRSVRFYDKAISEKEIERYFYLGTNPDGKHPEILVWIDFNLPEMRNMGSYLPEVSLHGHCRAMDVIYAAAPVDGDRVVPVLPISKEKFSNDEFSVYAKFFLPWNEENSGKEEKQIIVEKKLDERDPYKVRVYLKNAFDENEEIVFIPGVEIIGESGNVEGYVEEESKPCIDGQWNEMLVVCAFEEGKKKVTLFVNEEKFEEEEEEEMRLWNIENVWEEISFKGHLTKLAVFNKALTLEDALAFRENEPFIYEDGLYELYSFESGTAVELVFCSPVPAEWFPNIQLVADTNDWAREPYRYRITKESVKDESILEKASNILRFLSDYYQETYGLVPSDSTVNDLIRYFGKEFIENKWVQPLVSKESFSYEEMEKMLKELDDAQHVRLLELLKFNKLENILEPNETPKSVRGRSLSFASFAVRVGSVPIAMLVHRIKEKVDEYIAEKKDNEKEFHLISLTLQHSPEDFFTEPGKPFRSAVYVRDFEKEIKSPEWRRKLSNGVKPAIYIADRLPSTYVVVYAECVFYHIDSIHGGGRQIHLRGIPVSIDQDGKETDNVKGGFFTALKGKTKGQVNQKIPFKIELHAALSKENFPEDSERMYKYTGTYRWEYHIGSESEPSDSASAAEQKAYWVKTEERTPLLIYTLPTTPALPFSLDKEHTKSAPIIEIMELGFMGKSEEEKLRQSIPLALRGETLEEFVDRLYSNQNLQYAPNSYGGAVPYIGGQVRLDHNGTSVWAGYINLDQFVREAQERAGEAVQRNCQEYACVIAACGAIQGKTLRIYRLAARRGDAEASLHTNPVTVAGRNHTPVWAEDLSPTIVGGVEVAVEGDDVYHVGEVRFISHYIAVEVRDDGEYVYDPTMRLQSDNAPIAGMIIGTYVQRVFGVPYYQDGPPAAGAVVPAPPAGRSAAYVVREMDLEISNSENMAYMIQGTPIPTPPHITNMPGMGMPSVKARVDGSCSFML